MNPKGLCHLYNNSKYDFFGLAQCARQSIFWRLFLSALDSRSRNPLCWCRNIKKTYEMPVVFYTCLPKNDRKLLEKYWISKFTCKGGNTFSNGIQSRFHTVLLLTMEAQKMCICCSRALVFFKPISAKHFLGTMER